MAKALGLIYKSFSHLDGNVNSCDEIENWLEDLNSNRGETKKISINECEMWTYDQRRGCIHNINNDFFSITGSELRLNNELIVEQPLIIQNEIGLIGFIIKKINGVLNVLIQAKFEPGNINGYQLSPSVQATRSNILQKHGGNKPDLIELFINGKRKRPEVLIDSLQSEQTSRFYKKRNRNMIIMLDDSENIKLKNNYKWMTLGQLQYFLKYDNLVNMDSRSLLSLLVVFLLSNDKGIFVTQFSKADYMMNNFKMFNNFETILKPISNLKNWVIDNYCIVHKEKYDFKVVYVQVKTLGREVSHWSQPIVETKTANTYGLIITYLDGILHFLIRMRYEIGCQDIVEFGASVQTDSIADKRKVDNVRMFFDQCIAQGNSTIFNAKLSEEGGRFLNEVNKYQVIMVEPECLPKLNEDYFLASVTDLFRLLYSNKINMQLRTLISAVRPKKEGR